MNFVLNRETIAWLIGGAGTLGGLVLGFMFGNKRSKGKVNVRMGSDLYRDYSLVFADLIQRMQSDPDVPEAVKNDIDSGKINEKMFRELINLEIMNTSPDDKNILAVRTLLTMISDEEAMYNKAVRLLSENCK